MAATHLSLEAAAESRSFAPTDGRGQVQSGVVESFKTERGFGFIKPDTGGPDLFVHISELERAGLDELSRGQRVSFEVRTDPRTGKHKATRLSLSP